MKDLKTIRGMPDLYAEEMNRISFVEDVCTEIFRSFNFQEFRTPILENKSLFERSADLSNNDLFSKIGVLNSWKLNDLKISVHTSSTKEILFISSAYKSGIPLIVFKSFIVLILYYFFAQQFSLPLLQGTFPNLLYLLYMLAFLLSRLNVEVMHLSLQHLLLLIHQDHLHNNRLQQE